MASFPIQPLSRFAGASTTIKRPREFACFSYDDNRTLHTLSEASLRYYYPPFIDAPGESGQRRPPIDLSEGFDSFKQHDDKVDEHLDSLLETVAAHEEKTGERVQADVVTWRGMMTKLMTAPFDKFSDFEMNATCFQGTIFIEENHAYKTASESSQQRSARPNPPGGHSQALMQYWGYKFESLSVLPNPWAVTPRATIESRPSDPVNNTAQYCSLVTTAIGPSTLVLGGEVDCVLGAKPPPSPSSPPIPWIELKTSQQPVNDRDDTKYERKLLKFWAQSFLLGVPKIVVGFRSPDGFLLRLREHETQKIPSMVKRVGKGTWDGNTCINFSAAVLEFIKVTIKAGGEGGCWRIRRRKGEQAVEVFRVEGVNAEAIVTLKFRKHREDLVAKDVVDLLRKGFAGDARGEQPSEEA